MTLAKRSFAAWLCVLAAVVVMSLSPYGRLANAAAEQQADAGHPHVPAVVPGTHGAGHAHAEFWVCPMHPNVKQDHPGRCRICGMNLVPYHGAAAKEAPADPVAHAHVQSLVASQHQTAQSTKTLWVCPMHPQIMQDHRGHCPICGMNLVAYHGDGGADSGPALHVSSETQQKLGVRVVAAKRITIGRPIVTYGTVQPNENIVRDITPNTTGIIRKLYVTAVGDQVKVGQPLYQIFSQDLFMRQNDLIDNEDRRRQTLTSIRLTDEQNQRTLRAMQKNGSVLAARQKLNMRQANERNALMLETITREDTRLRDLLKYGGITDAMIKHVLKTRHAYDVWTVRATHPGYITSISVHPGSRVAPGTILFRTADLSKVWIDIALYPDQAPWVADGDAVSVSVPYTVRKPVSGKIIFISPLADGGTGIVHARVALDNADGRLRPGAFVDATIRARRHEALAIPRTALLRTGEGDMVMLALGDGHFLPTRVRTGLEDGDQVEVLSGLQSGAKVVVNGQFLLDAAAELSSAAQRMRTPAPAARDGH